MKPYDLRESALRIIVPYKLRVSRWELLPPDEMENRCPRLWKDYLLPLRSVLARREKGRWDGATFYQYSRPQNFQPLSSPKIISPDICEHPQMCWDATGEFKFSGGAAGGVAIVPKSNVPPNFLMGVLNSKLGDHWIRTNGTPFRGGYLNCEIRFIRDFPIRLPETASENKLAARIVEAVREIMAAKVKLRDAKLSDRERRTLEGDVEHLEQRIDEAVFPLYGIDGLPA